MAFDPSQYHRRSIRLKGYDYHLPGAYFITLCTQGHRHHFGHIAEWEMCLNAIGRMVRETWLQIPDFYRSCKLDEFVVMPNHFHGILWLTVDAMPKRTEEDRTASESIAEKGIALSPLSLPELVQRFKLLTTTKYGQGVASAGWPPYVQRLWQKGYFEHVIRNKQELIEIRIYIRENPSRWDHDPER